TRRLTGRAAYRSNSKNFGSSTCRRCACRRSTQWPDEKRPGSVPSLVTSSSDSRHAERASCSSGLLILGAMLTRRMFLRLMGASAGAAALTGTELLSNAAAAATPALKTNGSNGIEHIVILMMENRSFDHYLGWLPGADGRLDMEFLSTDGNVY